jgi:tRNA threonylcarbamoyladenosine biosynthesis protein TsaE
MPETIDLPDEAATLALGEQLAAVLRPGDVVTLAGPLGSGKTTLARGLLAALGLEGEAASPSYPIVIAYEPPELVLPVWHVDLYRIDDPEELEELGLLEARNDAALLIEWPERLAHPFTDTLALQFAPDNGGGRRLTWTAGASWGERWPPLPR